MDYNYHNHTPYCRHATGSPEEYVLEAFKMGIVRMGFSDHFPIRFPDGYEKGWRIQMDEVGLYLDEIAALKRKYEGKIEISLGFEMEYYPDFFDDMLTRAVDYGAEYIILGQHFVNSEADHPKNRHSVLPTDSEEILTAYVDGVVEAIGRGVFTYVAHPDIINFTADSEVYDREMRKICVASAEHQVPLEINFLGIREKRNYPNGRFWKIAGEVGSPVTFGLDAHRVANAYDGESLIEAESMVRQYGLNYIGAPKLIHIGKI